MRESASAGLFHTLKTEALQSLSSSLYAGRITAVHLDEVHTQVIQGVRKPCPIHYADLKSWMRVYMRDPGAATMYAVRPSITIGGGKGTITIAIPLQLLVPEAELESRRQTLIEKIEEEAPRQASQCEPPRDVRLVDVKLEMTIQAGKEKDARTESAPRLQQRLLDSLSVVADSGILFAAG